MRKTLSLSLILASSLLLSACGVKNNNSADSSDKSASKTSFSLRELIAQNIPQKCTYSGSNEDGSFDSEIIISGKKFSQIIRTKSVDGEQTINSVSDGEYIYTWGSHASNGGTFAMKLRADFDTTSSSETNDQPINQEVAGSQVDLDTNFQGKCSPTVVTDSNFQPPKDVKFEDYSKFLDDLKSSIPEINVTDSE